MGYSSHIHAMEMWRNQLLSVSIKGFRSLRNTQLSLNKGLNLLVGANGSGKSNIIRVLALADLLIRFGAGVAVSTMGGSNSVFSRQRSRTVPELTATFTLDPSKLSQPCPEETSKVSWSFTLLPGKKNQSPRLLRESFSFSIPTSKKSTNIKTVRVLRNLSKSSEGTLSVETSNCRRIPLSTISDLFPKRKKESTIFPSTLKSRLEELFEAYLLPDQNSGIHLFNRFHDGFSFLFRLLSSHYSFNFRPKQAKESSPGPLSLFIDEEGKGLIPSIGALQSGEESSLSFPGSLSLFADVSIFHVIDQKALSKRDNLFHHLIFRTRRIESPRLNTKEARSLLRTVNDELTSAVSGIDNLSVKYDNSDGHYHLAFESGDCTFSENDVSDGTIKWLCALVGTILSGHGVSCVEEPENFMHPWMQKRFMEFARGHCSSCDQIMVIATHSPGFLSAADYDEVNRVHFSPDEGTRVDKLDFSEEQRERFQNSEIDLGHLWLAGLIDAVPGV